MKFRINYNNFSAAFAVPSIVADKYLKLADGTQLKVLLCALKNGAEGIDSVIIAEKLSLSESDTADALSFWEERGILASDGEIGKTVTFDEKPKTVIPRAAVKPDRNEVARRGTESSDIAFLLREAQYKFGRPLRQNEASTLVWLADDNGMNTSIILMLITFAISEGKGTIGFIEKTAVSWINDGVTEVGAAEKKINEYYEKKNAWKIVSRAMGISDRMPSAKESEAAYLWVVTYKYGDDILRAAYEKCVDSTSKFSIPYIKKIIEAWHSAGVKTLEDILKLDAADTGKKQDKSSMATYDLDLYTQKLNELP